MKAKDTELTIDEINDIPGWNSIDLDPVIKLQAEITWDIAKQEGRKEVIAKIIKDKDIPVRYSHNATCYDCLQRLKEWCYER